jgi:hypothetical protein
MACVIEANYVAIGFESLPITLFPGYSSKFLEVIRVKRNQDQKGYKS